MLFYFSIHTQTLPLPNLLLQKLTMLLLLSLCWLCHRVPPLQPDYVNWVKHLLSFSLFFLPLPLSLNCIWANDDMNVVACTTLWWSLSGCICGLWWVATIGLDWSAYPLLYCPSVLCCSAWIFQISCNHVWFGPPKFRQWAEIGFDMQGIADYLLLET